MCAMHGESQNNCSYCEGNSKGLSYNIGLCSQCVCCVYGLTSVLRGMKCHLVLKDF